ncbi:MAG: hypothetical protein CVV21_10560 [Candidatus Goldiibacteriota bacterium HGW-Goldbacteria-1]|jgi:hypothetical protein|nr:MAG: hypothetical protein CVV21_10560 [Candidatus Goldiibacteriota bacterium HGW-Goldbacteria-1]
MPKEEKSKNFKGGSWAAWQLGSWEVTTRGTDARRDERNGCKGAAGRLSSWAKAKGRKIGLDLVGAPFKVRQLI